MHLIKIKLHQKGSSLIEVMVALTILAVGLLGMAQLQNRSSQDNQTAYYYSQAVFLAEDLAERMRSNPTVHSDYEIALDDTLSTVSTTQCETGNCTASQLASWDLKRWKDDLAELLPQGDGSVTSVGDGYAFVVQFDDSRGKKDSVPASFTFRVRF